MIKRPYRHYSETDLAQLARDIEQELEQPSPVEQYLMKQQALIEAELGEREFEEY